MVDLIEKYSTQYEEFVNDIDDLKLDEKLRKVPSMKHHFVARLMDAKRDRDRLNNKLMSASKKVQGGIIEKSPVALNEREIAKQSDNSPTIKEIREEIQEMNYVIEYLELVIKQITFIGNDFKNIIEWKKLELL